MKKMFLKQSKTVVESLKNFYETTGYLADYESNKWQKDTAPQWFNHYYKFTSNLIMQINYEYSKTNYGMTIIAKLKEIIVAFRDGNSEYELIREKLRELKEERSKNRNSKNLDKQIAWLEHLNQNIEYIMPKFTKCFNFNTGEKSCSESISIDKTKISQSSIANQYVVLDLETNGLRTANDDLLSIALYDPSNGKTYSRLLPLELQPTVLTTYINGIDDTDIENEVPLSQKEFDDLITEFKLTDKIILFYSGGKFDYNFLNKYCTRHKICGMESLRFENIKDKIASDVYAAGNLTKDNLCNALGISGVSKVHNGINDCYLEWRLFEQFVCDRLLIKNDCIYKFSDDYIIPASYLTSFPRLAELANIEVPILCHQHSLLFEFYLPSNLTKKIRKFPTNITGISIENMINSMVGAKECDSKEFLILNNSKLKIVGKLPSKYEEIPIIKNEDGTLKSLTPENEEYIRVVNETCDVIRSGIDKVIDFIKTQIFLNKEIRTQEISFSENNKVLALCDLSSDDAVLEIKTFDIFNSYKAEDIIQQMYYQKGNRELYAMSVIFELSHTKKGEQRIDNLIFKIYKVEIIKK